MGCGTSSHAGTDISTTPDGTTTESFDEVAPSMPPRERQRHNRARNVLRLKPRDLDAIVDTPSDGIAARVADQQVAQRARVQDALMNLLSRSSQHRVASTTTGGSRSHGRGGDDGGLQRFHPHAEAAREEERRASSWYNSFAPGLNSSVSAALVPPSGSASSPPPVRLGSSLPVGAASGSSPFLIPNPLRATPTVAASPLLRSSANARSRSARSASRVDGRSDLSPSGIELPAGDPGAVAMATMDEDTYRAQSVFDFPSRAAHPASP